MARADAQRNRERLLAAATTAFAAHVPLSLEAIAREAGVGIGTLYRHFPSREALVEAVYRAELEQVTASAAELAATTTPAQDALRLWLTRYAAFVAAKRGMAESLRALLDAGGPIQTETRASVIAAVGCLLRAGGHDGSLRPDVPADDVVAMLIGIFVAGASPEQTARLLDLLVAGLRT